MRILNVDVVDKIATGDGQIVVCDNSDYVVRFHLDDEWDDYHVKTMRLVFSNGEAKEIVFTGNECPLPVIVNRTRFEIGLYAGNLRTTVSAFYDCKTTILSNGDQHDNPTEDVYNQLIALIEAGAVKGDTGNGIASIVKTGTSGNIDTYTITYTDGTTTTFNVTNGTDGVDGNGIASITQLSTSGLEKTYRITFTDGTHFDYVVTDGVSDIFDTALTKTDAQKAQAQENIGLGNVEEDITELRNDLDDNLLDKIVNVNPANWYNASAITSGKIMDVDGTATDNSSYSYTDYVPVSPGEKIGLYRGDNLSAMYMYKVAAFNSSKEAISAKGRNTNTTSKFTVPEGIAFIIITAKTANLSYSPIIYKGATAPTAYSAYFTPYEVYTEDFITPESEEAIAKIVNKTLSTKDIANKYACALPKQKLRFTVGIEETWYKKNMATPYTEYVYASIGSGRYVAYNDRIEFPNTSSVDSVNGYIWIWWDCLLNEIYRVSANQGYGYGRKIMTENLADCSCLVIGDSTVDQDVMTQKMLDYFTNKSKTLTLLGTLGSGNNKNEGRAGWKASDYLTDKQYNGVTNPFYNPSTETFDFAYYMTNQGYSAPDFVVIQLGINDLYNSDVTVIPSVWNCIKTMIDSILSYNNNIKIILDLPTTPNSDQSEHSVIEFNYRNRVIKYNEYALAQVISLYGDTAVRCSYCHLILDPDTDIRDNVHPTEVGYQKMAYEIINQINCWQAGE